MAATRWDSPGAGAALRAAAAAPASAEGSAEEGGSISKQLHCNNSVRWQVSHLGERVGKAAHPGPAPYGRAGADPREPVQRAPGGPMQSPARVSAAGAGWGDVHVALAEAAAAAAPPSRAAPARDTPQASGPHAWPALRLLRLADAAARGRAAVVAAEREARTALGAQAQRRAAEGAPSEARQAAEGRSSTAPQTAGEPERGEARWAVTERQVSSAVEAALGVVIAECPAKPVARLAELLLQGHSEGTQPAAQPADAASYLRAHHVTEHLDAALAAIREQRPKDPVRAVAARLAATAGFPPMPRRGRWNASNSPQSSPRSPGPRSPRAWARDGLELEQEQRAQQLRSPSSCCPLHPEEPLSVRSLADWAELAAAGDSGALTAVACCLSLPPSDVPAEYMESPVDWDTEEQQGPTQLQRMLSRLDPEQVAEARRLLSAVVAGAAEDEPSAVWLARARRLFLGGEHARGEGADEQRVWRDALLNGTVARAGQVDIVLTEATRIAAEQVADALELGAPVLLEGPTGTGKTMISHLALRLLADRRAKVRGGMQKEHSCTSPAAADQELLRFNLSASVEPEDLLFRWAADPENGGAVTYPQPFAEAAREGRVILLDEMNLAREAVLNVIESVIDHRNIAYNDPSSWGVTLNELKVHEDFRIIATQNPAAAAGYEGHRVALSPPFLSRFRRVPLPPTERDDLVRVVCSRLSTPEDAAPDGRPRDHAVRHLGTALVEGHLAVSRLPCDHVVLDCVTVRDLLRWAESLPPISGRDLNSTAVAEVGWLCYCARYADQGVRLQRCDTLLGPLRAEFPDRDFSVQALENGDPEPNSAEQSQDRDYVLQGPFALLRKRLQRALTMGRPLLLLGPPGSGKTRAVEQLCSAEGRELRYCLLTASTETATLVGQYLPAEGGKVEWTDGCVSSAYQKGHTLLLDNIDAAPATVCERLNPVIEFPPVWTTPERNTGVPPVMAEGFKIIATCSNAESLTPAFFNRFLVVSHVAAPDEVVAAICRVPVDQLAGLRAPGGAGLLHALRMREAVRQLGDEGARWVLGGAGPVPIGVRALAAEVWSAHRRRMDGLAAPIDAPPSTADSPPPTPKRVHPFADLVRRGGALLSLGLPVLVRGGAGWGASTLALDVARQHSTAEPVVFIATSEATVTDLICSPTLDGKGAPGPLLRAWRSGRVLVIEGANRLPGGLLAELAPALRHSRAAGKVCAEQTLQADQLEDDGPEADNGFGIIAVLRTKDKLEACQHLFVELPVPDPAEAWRRSDRQSAPTLYQVLAKGSGLSEKTAQAAAYLPQMTPRVFACVVQRTKVLQPLECEHQGVKVQIPVMPNGADRHWANCCVSWLLPALPPADDRTRFKRALSNVWKDYDIDDRAPRILQVKRDSASEDRVCFAQWGLYCELPGSLDAVQDVLGPPDESLDGPDQKQPDTPVSEQAVTAAKLRKGKREVVLTLKRALCSIAFAHSARQTIALVGPPSFKSFALQLFGSILGGCRPVRVQIAPGTIAQDLLGSIRPRTRQERSGWFSANPHPEAAPTEPGGCEAAPGDLRLEFEPAVVTVEAERYRSGPCLITFEGAECASGDLLGELGVLLRERELLLEVGGMGEQPIRVRRTTTFCLVACPPASALCALGGIATHWCPAYGPDEQNSILADLVRSKARVAPQPSSPASGPAAGGDAAAADGPGAAAPPGGEAEDDVVAQAVGVLVAQFAHCPLRERLRLAQLVCTLAEEGSDDGLSTAVGPERLVECADAVYALFGPRAAARRASAADGAPSGRCQGLSGYKGLHCDGGFVYIGASIKVRCVAMSKKKLDELEQDVKRRVHTGAQTFTANLARVCLAAQHRFPIALQGPPGTGKTLVAEQAARLLGHEFRRVQLSKGTTDADVYGSLMPARHGNQGDLESAASGAPAAAGTRRRSSATRLRQAPQGYQWTDGVISGAIREFNKKKRQRDREQEEGSAESGADKKLWLCMDEFNLAPHAVLQCLLPLLSGDEALSIPQTAEQLCIKDVVVIATFNPASVGGGREPLPHSISNCLLPVSVEEMGHAEVRDILREGRVDPHGYRCSEAAGDQDRELVDALIRVHEGASTVVSKKQLQHQYPINLRTLETVVQCFGPLVRRMQRGEHRGQNARFLDVMHAVYCAPHPPGDVRNDILHCVLGAAEQLGASNWHPAERRPAGTQRGWTRWGPGPHTVMTDEYRDVLGFLATVQPSGRAVLLHGPQATGKTAALRDFARRCRRDLVVIPAHLFTDEGDLVGQVCVSGMSSGAYADARSTVARQAQRVAGAAVLHAPLGTERCALLKRLCGELGGPAEAEMRAALGALAELAAERQEALSTGGAGERHTEAGDVVLARYAQLLATLEGHSCQLHEPAAAAGQPAVSFHFVESALVHAALTGKWVLIEGIDRAPPNAIERLNPLLEAWASLDLPERDAVSRATSRPLTPEDGIHPGFRLFATASGGRSVLPASLLNRMVCIHFAAPAERSSADLLGLCTAADSSDAACFVKAIEQLMTLGPAVHEGSVELSEADRAARLRTLRHGTEMWANSIKQGGLRSLVFHLLAALTAEHGDAQSAAQAAAPLQGFLQVLQARHDPGLAPGGGEQSAEVSKAKGTAKRRVTHLGDDDVQKSDRMERDRQPDAAGQDPGTRREAGHATWSSGLIDGAWALRQHAAGKKRADVIIDEQKARLLAQGVRQLWRAQPGTVLAEMLRCIRSSDPGDTGRHLRDKAAELQHVFFQKDPGPVELFLLWWYSTEGLDVDRVCGFSVSPPKWEWVRATWGEVRQIKTKQKEMRVELFKRKKHVEITACPAGYEQYVGRWLGPIVVRGSFLSLEKLTHEVYLPDAEPATFTVRPAEWQDYAQRKERRAHESAEGDEPVHYEQEYNRKWGDARNVSIPYAMVGAMRVAAVKAEGMTMAGSLIKSIALLGHLGWRAQGPAAADTSTPKKLYRGIGQLPEHVAEEYRGLKVGTTMVFLSPTSTSTDRNTALGFIKGNPEYAFFFEIIAPDFAGIQMHVSQYPGEVETLLPPFTKLVIEKVIPPGKGEPSDSGQKATYIRARLVGCELFDADESGFRVLIENDVAEANRQLQAGDASLHRLTMESMLGETVDLAEHYPLEEATEPIAVQQCLDASAHYTEEQGVDASKSTLVTIAGLPCDSSIELDRTALERFKERVPKSVRHAAAGSEWDEVIALGCYDADLVQEVASALAISLPPGAPQQRGPPAARGSRLHIRALVRAIASRFTYRRIFVGRAQSGGQPQAAVMLLVDMAPGASQLALLSVLQRALRDLGIRPGVAVHSGHEVWCISPPGQQWTRSAGAALLGLFAARSQFAAPLQDCSPAVHFAASALAAAQAPAHRLLWLTQGDRGSFQAQQRHGSRRAAVLAGAQAADVEVIAVCLKPDGAAAVSGNVHVSAHRAVTVSGLAHLPRALRRVATGDSDPLDDALRTTAAEQLAGARVLAAGYNHQGQMGVSPDEVGDQFLTPIDATGLQPPRGVEIVEVYCGAIFVLMRTAQGDVLHAGASDHGERGDGRTDQGAFPELSRVPLAAPAVNVVAGYGHAAAVLTDRSVHTWGANSFEQLGRSGAETAPQAVPGISDVERVSAGSICTFVHRRGGEVCAFGENGAGQLGLGRAGPAEGAPQRVAALCGVPVLHLTGGFEHCIALRADGRALAWGRLNGRLADGSADWTVERGCLPIVLQIGPQVSASAGWEFCGSVGRDGVLRMWGDSYAQQPAAVPLPGGTAAREVDCGFATVFVRAAGGEWTAMGEGHRGLPFGTRDKVEELRALPEACADCRRVVTGPPSGFALYLCSQ